MLLNYIKIAVRAFARNKSHVLINILGMGVALACCIVAYMNYLEYNSFNDAFKDTDHVYRVNSLRILEGEERIWDVSPMPLGPAMKDAIPGVVNAARFDPNGTAISYDNRVFMESTAFTDPSFFDMLDFPIIKGSARVLNDPSTILITDELAERLFGQDEPIGKQVTLLYPWNEERLFTVGAIMKDLPDNCSFYFQIAIAYDVLAESEGWQPNEWDHWQQPLNFVQLADATAIADIEEKAQQFIGIQNEARPNWKIQEFFLQPFDEIAHHSSHFEGNALRTPPPFQLVLMQISLAGLILLIACFNFTNTTIALSGSRLREIGVRKAMGAFRSHLIRQFLMESLVMCSLALVLGLLFAELLGSQLYEWGMSYQPRMEVFTDWRMWSFLVVLVGATALVAGGYPAFYISSFQPVEIFRRKSKFKGSNLLTYSLLTLQFAASILAVIAGIVFTQNANYQAALPVGYNKEEILMVNIVNPEQFERFSNEIRENAKIKSIAGTAEQVGVWAYGAIFKPGPDATEEREVFVMNFGENYIETMDLEIVEGRAFNPEITTDFEDAAIVNETLVKEMGWDNALDRHVEADGRPFKIIGVMKDFKQLGMRAETPPIIMHFVRPDRFYSMSVRVDKRDMGEVRDYLEATWRELFPAFPFYGRPLEEVALSQDYQMNRMTAGQFLFLAIVATALSVSGLFAMVSLRIISRTKEIGVRKVLGAPLTSLVHLISKEFLVILGIAAFLGSVIAYLITDQMLEDMFIYHISITIVPFVLAMLIILVAAILTVGYKVLSAAMANPVDSLRYE